MDFRRQETIEPVADRYEQRDYDEARYKAPPMKKDSSGAVLRVFILALLIAAVAGGVWYFQQNVTEPAPLAQTEAPLPDLPAPPPSTIPQQDPVPLPGAPQIGEASGAETAAPEQTPAPELDIPANNGL